MPTPLKTAQSRLANTTRFGDEDQIREARQEFHMLKLLESIKENLPHLSPYGQAKCVQALKHRSDLL